MGTEQPPLAQFSLHSEMQATDFYMLFTVLFKENTCGLIYLILICIFLIILRLQKQSSLPSETFGRSVNLIHLTANADIRISAISPVPAIIWNVFGITKCSKLKTKTN